MEVQTVSETWVRPATPTPTHLKYYKLSLLDQVAGAVDYFKTVFFYNDSKQDENGGNMAHKLQLLKTSLSQILPKFYPVAGKIQDELTIDCNDQGVRFVEAQVNCDANQFMTGNDLSMINMFHPVINDKTVTSDIKVSIFKCGGLAIGFTISHKIFDAASLSLFMNAWADTAKLGSTDICPVFSSNLVFPEAADNWLSNMIMHMSAKRTHRTANSVTRKYTFSSASITKLRDLAISEQPPRRATSVEAISALIWKSFLISSRKLKKQDATSLSLLRHSVNLRSRINPIFMPEIITKHTVGNLVWNVRAIAQPTDKEPELGNLSLKIRKAISKVDAEFIEKLRGDETEVKEVVKECLKSTMEVVSDPESESLLFTSWCKMGLYEADFGWGKPRWIGLSSISVSKCLNLVRMMELSNGLGIEVWVTMDEALMDCMFADTDFSKFATLTQTQFGI